MRILALPAAVLLAFCVYPLLPKAPEWIASALRALHGRLFHTDSERETKATVVFLLLVCGIAALFCALHPVCAMLAMAPLFTAASVFPGCARLKAELDSGAYARSIPEYEQKVRAACFSLADPFIQGLAAPLLLCAIGTALHLGGALAWGYAALLALKPQGGRAKRLLDRMTRFAEHIFCALLSLCAGVVGRSSLSVQSGSAAERLVRTLGIAEDTSGTHAPVSGDITQGVFLCCFCCVLLCFALCLALIPIC